MVTQDMTPKDVSRQLKLIADAIDRAKTPSRTRVARELNSVVAAFMDFMDDDEDEAAKKKEKVQKEREKANAVRLKKKEEERDQKQKEDDEEYKKEKELLKLK